MCACCELGQDLLGVVWAVGQGLRGHQIHFAHPALLEHS
jgi:hypothetical protein